MQMLKSILANHEGFEKEIEKILQYASELMADLPYKRQTTLEEKYLLLESLILRACALWEKFIENQLILLVKFSSYKFKQEMGLSHKTKLDLNLIRAILFSDIYRDFHDIDRSKSFFKKYIDEKNNSFEKIPNEQLKSIQFIYKIRNYLSHYSDFSKKKLFDAYKKEYRLKRFFEPGQFLFKQKGKKFQDLVANFKYASIYMKSLFRSD